MINRTLVAFAAMAGLALASTATASATSVGSGALTWSQTNVYASTAEWTAAPNTNRTWLGYLARTGTPAIAFPNGSVTPGNGATGDIVTAASPKSPTAAYSQTYGAGIGAYDAATKTGTVTFTGTVAHSGPNHGIDFTFANPTIFLRGATGTLAFNGIPDAPAPLFNLDLSKAVYTDNDDGSHTISGIVPSIARADIFGGAYPVGSGPNRVPNIFGAFSVTFQDVFPKARVAELGYKKGTLPRISVNVEGPSSVKVVLKKHVKRGSKTVVVRVGAYDATFTKAGTVRANVKLTDWGRSWLRRSSGEVGVEWSAVVTSRLGNTGSKGTLQLTGQASATR